MLDLETSGVSPLRDRVIEVCGVRLGPDYGVEAQYHSLVRFEGELSSVVTRITGITKEDLEAKGRPAEEVFREFREFIADRVLVGHNIDGFDLPFLRAEMGRLGTDILNETFDTLKASRRLFRFYSYGLEMLAKHLGIWYDGRMHNARTDVAVTVELFRRLRAGEWSEGAVC